jgi:hypothetical protein
VDASVSARRNLRDCIARSRVLTSVRPLLRPFICRGPVWEFADRIQITVARSRPSVKNWLADSRLSSTVRHTFLPTALRLPAVTSGQAATAGAR